GSVPQRGPAGPAAIPHGWEPAVGMGNSSMSGAPSKLVGSVSRPTLLASYSVNQMLPSGPRVMSLGWAPALRPVYSCTSAPSPPAVTTGVSRAILFAVNSATQSPSGGVPLVSVGPAEIPGGAAFPVRSNSWVMIGPPFGGAMPVSTRGVARLTLSLPVVVESRGSVVQIFPSGPVAAA